MYDSRHIQLSEQRANTPLEDVLHWWCRRRRRAGHITGGTRSTDGAHDTALESMARRPPSLVSGSTVCSVGRTARAWVGVALSVDFSDDVVCDLSSFRLCPPSTRTLPQQRICAVLPLSCGMPRLQQRVVFSTYDEPQLTPCTEVSCGATASPAPS